MVLTVTVTQPAICGDTMATEKPVRRHKPLTEFQLREHAQSILKRVMVTRLHERVERLEPGWYVVRSTSTAGTHVVKGPPRWRWPWELECECRTAGWAYPMCVHVGAVLVARWHAQGFIVTQAVDGRVLVARDSVDLSVPIGEYPALIATVEAPPAHPETAA